MGSPWQQNFVAKFGCSQNLWELLKGKPILAELMRPIDKSSGDVTTNRTTVRTTNKELTARESWAGLRRPMMRH